MVRVHFGPPLQTNLYGGLAQLGERLPCKQEVTGSIPVLSTMRKSQKRLTEALCEKYFIESLRDSKCTLKTEHCYYDAIMRRQHKGKFI